LINHHVKPARRQSALRSEPFHRYVLQDGTVWTEFYRAADGYLLRFPGLADFEVSADGIEVTAYPFPGIDEPTTEHLYINQIVPLAMSRQGLPAFHASVVTVPSGAVAFLGQSGRGKSTLAASFALGEAEFLTDDALFVEEINGGCRVLPSHASLRLWEDSVDALIGTEIPRAGSISYTTKARLLAGEGLAYSETARTLLAAYVLEPQGSTTVSIQPLTGVERFVAWLGNSFLLDIEDRELLERHFEWTHRISSIVPTFTLDYPRDYAFLPKVRNAIRQHISNPGS
jgi:hypothetical protein